jgi:hypothetical protein
MATNSFFSLNPSRHSRIRAVTAALIASIAMCGLTACGGGGGGASTVAAVQLSSDTTDSLTTSLGSTNAGVAKAAGLNSGSAAAVSPRFSVAMDDMEIFGPFASWANVKRDYGAIGNGVADDAPALQKALNELGQAGKASVLYLPAGNYKIGTTLYWKGSPLTGGFGYGGLTLVGDSPSTTRITWAGTSGLPMLVQDGGMNYRYSRITWDGKGLAGYGVAHWWNATLGTFFDSSPEHTDEVFQDMRIGIMGGRLGAAYGQLNSEGLVRRVTFLRNTYAGLNTGSWNALDWWVWDSHFIDCARGVSNTLTINDSGETLGSGGVYVYRSLFERSTVADFHIGNTGWFSMHQNVSVGSKQFFLGAKAGNNSAQIVLMGNRIVDTTDSAAISNGNSGPLMLIDNQIRSAEGSTGPAVLANNTASGRDVVSIGNKYTVANPILQVDVTDRRLTQGDSVVDRSTISASLLALPSTPARITTTVFEVSSGSNAAAIQAVVDAAVASKAVNPIVHFAPGEYIVGASIVVPAKARIRLAGDAWTTVFRWSGVSGGTVFKLLGPSYATIRDLQVVAAGTAYLASLSSADQVGGRVFLEGNSLGVIKASNLAMTQVHLQANSGINGMQLDGVKSLSAISNGGLGPVKMTNSSYALIADTWYEGSETEMFRLDNGSLTYVGGHIASAPVAGAANATSSPVLLDGFKGQATFIATQFNAGKLADGVAIKVANENAETNALFLGNFGSTSDYFKRVTPGVGSVGMLMSKNWSTTLNYATSLPNDGLASEAFVNKMLAQLRALTWESSAYAPPDASTDVRIYRVKANQTNGLLITGN